MGVTGGEKTYRVGDPNYRQVHPNDVRDGQTLSPAFVLQDTGCHFTLSLNDGSRTTAERRYREYTYQASRQSAAVLEETAD